jgi:hypothetical protein
LRLELFLHFRRRFGGAIYGERRSTSRGVLREELASDDLAFLRWA